MSCTFSFIAKKGFLTFQLNQNPSIEQNDVISSNLYPYYPCISMNYFLKLLEELWPKSKVTAFISEEASCDCIVLIISFQQLKLISQLYNKKTKVKCTTQVIIKPVRQSKTAINRKMHINIQIEIPQVPNNRKTKGKKKNSIGKRSTFLGQRCPKSAPWQSYDLS